MGSRVTVGGGAGNHRHGGWAHHATHLSRTGAARARARARAVKVAVSVAVAVAEPGRAPVDLRGVLQRRAERVRLHRRLGSRTVAVVAVVGGVRAEAAAALAPAASRRQRRLVVAVDVVTVGVEVVEVDSGRVRREAHGDAARGAQSGHVVAAHARRARLVHSGTTAAAAESVAAE